MGAPISRPHALSPAEIRIRQFLQGKDPIEASLGPCLVRVQEFATSIMAQGIERTLNQLVGRETFKLGMDLIQEIAEKLTDHAQGVERDLLSKSVQESLFYSVGTDPDLSETDVRSHLKQYLNDHTPSALSHRFLSLGLFNLVWFLTSEDFRGEAATAAAFEQDLEDVEQACQKIVASACVSLNLMQRPVDAAAAGEFVTEIQQRLRGEFR